MIFARLSGRVALRRSLIILALVLLALGAGAAKLLLRPAPRDAAEWLALADQDVGKGDLPAATIALSNAAQKVPFSPGIRLRLAAIYMELGRYPLAENWAQLAKESGADPDQVDPLLAQALLQQSKLSALVRIMTPGTRNPKEEADVRVSLALAHIGLGDVATGAALIADAKRLDPTTPHLPLGLAKLALAKGDIAGAERALGPMQKGVPISPERLRIETDVLRAKGDLNGALALLTTGLARNPDDLSMLVGRADIEMAKGDLDGAQKDVTHALSLAPDSLTPNFLNALIAARRGDFVRADELVTAMSEYFPTLPAGYYLQGLVKYALGQYPIAEDSLTRYLGRRPGDKPALRLLAAIAVREKDYARAIHLLAPLAAADPGDEATLKVLVAAYLGAGRKDAVVRLYEKAAAATPGNAKRQTDAAMIEMRYGDASLGFADLEKIARTDTGIASAGPVVVLQDLKDGDVPGADATARALLAHDPDDLLAQDLVGLVRLAEFRFTAAERIFTAIIAKDPGFLAARSHLARTYLATNRVAAAKQVYLDILQRAPDNVAALVSLADLAETANALDEAAQYLRAAEKAAPGDVDPGLRLVQFYARHRQWNKARTASAALAARFPRDPRAVDVEASVLADSGDPAGAVKAFFPFTQWYANSASVLMRYAEYQAKAGDIAGARASLVRALVLQPNDTLVQTNLVDLDFRTKGPATALATARSLAPDDPVAAAMLSADVLERSGRDDAALAILRRAEADRPAEPVAIHLAELTYDSGQRAAGESLLGAWVAAHADAVPPRLALANLYLRDHDDAKAEPLYQQVVKLAPTNVIALNNLAWIYLDQHDPRAAPLARRAFDLARDGTTADTLGWLMVSDGDAAKGLPFLETAARVLPGNMSVQYHLAVALADTGARAKARALLARVVASPQTFTGKDDARRRLAGLEQP